MTEKATKDDFLRRIKTYCERTGMNERTLARLSINKEGSRTFFQRLRDDKASLELINRIDGFMHRHPDGPKDL